MDILYEKTKTLSSQEIYSIIDFAVQSADENGFMNSFVFQRALYCFAAICFYPERKEKITELLAQSPMSAWDYLLEDGTIEQMLEDFEADCDFLGEAGAVWFDEFTAYAHSARGLLDTIQLMSGNMVTEAAEQLRQASQSSDFQQVQEIADKWGMNNNIIDLSDESLFQ